MSYYRYQNNSGYHMRPRLLRGAIREIIIANAVIFLIMILFGLQRSFSVYFGLVPRLIWSKGFIWQLVTYMFIHGGFGHIFFNMFALWMFGMELENHWGKREFYRYYFITGIGSGLITFLFSWNSSIPVVGASGAIYAVLLAFGLMYPERPIYLYFLFPIKAKYLVLIMGALTFFFALSPGGSAISHLTHLGGLVIGFVYLRRHRLLRELNLNIRWPRIKLRNPFRNFIRRVPKDEEQQKDEFRERYDTDQTMREEVDRILDKINQKGYDSLSEEEKRTLYLASRYFAEKEKN